MPPGQIALVTGASSGIGLATSHRLAALGCALIVCARRVDRLRELALDIAERFRVQVLPVAVDARRAEDVKRMIDELPESWREIDILINNAGLARGLRPLYEARIDEVDDMVDTNVKGLIYFTRYVVPGMIERQRGHVVNIGSTAGHGVYPGGAAYCATKHAVRAITEGLKMDLHGTPIRVSSIDPGMVETEFSLVRFEGDADRAGSVYDGMTALTAEDVAEAITFAITRPAHINLSTILVMPTDQSSSSMVHRRS